MYTIQGSSSCLCSQQTCQQGVRFSSCGATPVYIKVHVIWWSQLYSCRWAEKGATHWLIDLVPRLILQHSLQFTWFEMAFSLVTKVLCSLSNGWNLPVKKGSGGLTLQCPEGRERGEKPELHRKDLFCTISECKWVTRKEDSWRMMKVMCVLHAFRFYMWASLFIIILPRAFMTLLCSPEPCYK